MGSSVPSSADARAEDAGRAASVEPDLDRLALEVVRTGDYPDDAVPSLIHALRALDPREAPSAGPGRLLAALTAIDPAIIGPEVASGLATIVERADLAETAQPGLDEAFALLPLLISTSAAEKLPQILYDVLTADGVHDRWGQRAIAILEELRRWRPGLMPINLVLAVAEASAPRLHRRIFQRLVVPSALADPEALDNHTFGGIYALPADPLEARYFAAAIAGHSAASQAVRDEAARRVERSFPLRQVWWRLLGARGLRVLCMQNIADGQGDEIIRVVPLLQALLDSHPETTATLITDRGYLYGHPRLEVISFDARARIERALAGAPDALIEFAELDKRHLNHDPELIGRIAQMRQARTPLLDIRAEMGWGEFTVKSLRLGGMEWAPAMKLDRRLDDSAYDPTFRLVMELGLPLRVGEMPPNSGPILAAWPDVEADTEWQQVALSEEPTRPIALVNPFGGAHRLKGFVEQTFDDLARVLISLVDKGYRVALCTHSAAWAGVEQAFAVCERLPPPYRRQVTVIGEPGRGVIRADAIDRSDIQGAQAAAAMRRRLRFVACADLVVTVEGWMQHAAYLLGKPYQVLMLPYSLAEGWTPWGRSHRQRFQFYVGEPNRNQPPLPEWPRKRGWLTLFDRVADPAWQPIVERACESEDRDIRERATRALGRIGPADSADQLGRLLRDPSDRVRGAAADALLTRHRSQLGVGGIPDAATLEPYRLISEERRDWLKVFRHGKDSLAALETAHWGDNPVIRREAAAVLEFMSRREQEMTDLHDAQGVAPTKETSATLSPSAIPSHTPTDPSPLLPRLLVLTPLKDAAACLPIYTQLISALTYPHDRIRLGFLESDSSDRTLEAARLFLSALRQEFAGVDLWHRDFGYRVPPGLHRGDPRIQQQRRSVLARSRNHLLSHALGDEEWVLWLDADLVGYPPDIIERLLASGKRIVQPHCVLDYGGPTFDQNAWRERGRIHLDDLRGEGDVVTLDTVGATMLLIHADLHRDGLIFPPVPYRPGHPKARRGDGELETEGLGLLASDMGESCWGMPGLEIVHRRA